LVGIERACQLHIGDPSAGGSVVAATPEREHEANLTRETTTSAVHYVRFALDEPEVEAFVAGPVRLVVDHPQYPDGRPGVVLSDATRAELAHDLRGG